MAERFGQTVGYIPDGGVSSDITAIWHPGQVLPSFYPDGVLAVLYGILKVNPDDVSAPTDRDSVTIDGDVWAVKEFKYGKNNLNMQLERRVQRTVGGRETKVAR